MPTLVVSPCENDHDFVEAALPPLRRPVIRARTRAEAAVRLLSDRPRAVVCERDLPDGGWKDVLDAMAVLEDMPPLVVVSALADERLWAEVLNLGGYDVLQKPFDLAEVSRVMALATGREREAGGRRRWELVA